ncbi:pseudouridine synthase [Lipingzhangella sp. LS1_29]|uniref:Pseudouridine synthase n=1 Tax=Lipingzhangella rawalii TaxID=2055835 RepID=A0ABU2H1Z1_9ACTN|nr:pseudouridine synthase [Lipingzhangella rawalii]MDS1269313.1 pseudouridine synthase [Lipingzhangella rawalii]
MNKPSRKPDKRPGASDRRSGRDTRGGRETPQSLSPGAQARLRRIRAEYDPTDEDRPEGDRDSYPDVPGGVRLQKVLAQAGVASRRGSEELIAAGRVSVDGHVVRRFGARVDPETSVVRVDEQRVVTAADRKYYALNKPRGVVSTMSDPQGRTSLADYAAETGHRLFHVGRLDTDTEGLILLTNDGELANRLTHPRYAVPKTYLASVRGPISKSALQQLRSGVELEDGVAHADAVRVVSESGARALVELTLHEGRNHIVRRMFTTVGHPVRELARTRVGPVELRSLKSGVVRSLTAAEVSALYTAVGL